jgi:hypothetical protein
MQELLSNKAVLARGRAIGLARLMCRQDIVEHLLLHGENVRTGKLPAHMLAVAEATEASLRIDALLMPTATRSRIRRANQRHHQTGVSYEQRLYVWATFVDGYALAAELSGYRFDTSTTAQYAAGGMSFARAFGLTGVPLTLDAMRESAQRLLAQIQPGTVPAGGWPSVMQVVRSSWFRQLMDDGVVNTATITDAVRRGLPDTLLQTLQG